MTEDITQAPEYDIDEIKRGARNSNKDKARLQTIHDYSVENGAMCAEKKDMGDMEGKAHEGETKALAPDSPVYFGGEIKALDNNGKIGGYLVRFSTANDPDLTGDFFTKDTDFGEPHKLPVLYQHGFDEKLGKKRIAFANVKVDEWGLWAETQLALREEYEKILFDMAKAGKLGYSSGAASHTVERVNEGKANWIKQWYMAEASLTPTPAESRNTVIPIKSLIPPDESMALKGDIKPIPMEGNQMENEELKAMFETQKADISALVKTEAEAAATKAVENVLEKLPEVKAKMNVDVVEDEADKALKGNPFQTKGEFLMAVKNAAIAPHAIDQRLLPLKATGLNEAIPSQGGFLVPPAMAAGIRERMYNTGSLLNLFSRDSVSGNSMTYNKVDETSRANGSRFGGVQGYWLAEAATKTASKPAFSQIELKLKKVAALCVATDELLSDASALESWITRNVPQELRFKVEDAIINGDGVGKPLGILTSGALKSVTRTDANEIDAYDIGRMWAGRWAGYNDYIWLGNQNIFPQMLNLVVGTTPVFLPAGGLGGLPYATLLGRPYYDVEYLPTLGSVGDLLLVSPQAYLMIEKGGGIEAASSIHVYFTADETAFRFVYRVDGAPEWDSALTGFDGQTYSPFVTLAATT